MPAPTRLRCLILVGMFSVPFSAKLTVDLRARADWEIWLVDANVLKLGIQDQTP